MRRNGVHLYNWAKDCQENEVRRPYVPRTKWRVTPNQKTTFERMQLFLSPKSSSLKRRQNQSLLLFLPPCMHTLHSPSQAELQPCPISPPPADL